MFRRRTTSSQPTSRHPGWRSYDDVAESYERLRAPVHEGPARDLIGAVAPPPGGSVLDVGTGTGVAALAAREAVGPDGTVVGVDRSVPMLHIARDKGTLGAAGEAIDLPFRDGTFDAVVAAFVIFHFPRYETGLFDMLRVLRPGGTLGVTTWAGGEDEFGRAWRETAESFAGRRMLRDAARRVAPWQERFSQPDPLQHALYDAGLRSTRVERHDYRNTVSIEDYLESRATTAQGRYLREILGETLWPRFRERVEATFRERFQDPLGDTQHVLIGVGSKP